MTVIERVRDLGLELPEPFSPVACYSSYIENDGLLHISGQLPLIGDQPITGRLGDNLDVAAGRVAAQACALMVIAQVGKALGGEFERIRQVVKVNVFVHCVAGFTEQSSVANGASELFEAVFGIAGRHARSAVGVAALPLGIAVEVDAVVAIDPQS